MNWTSEFNAESPLHCSGGFPKTNFQYNDSTEFMLRPTQEANINLQRENDQNFINNFIIARQKSDKIIPKSKLTKISVCKSILLEIVQQKKKAEKEVLEMNLSDENFDSKWEELKVKLKNIYNQVSKFESDVKPFLVKALKKRKKKRNAIKKRKAKYLAHKKLLQQKVQEKHEIIDKLLVERREEVEKIKHEAALKRQADTVLHEVWRKKFEGKKMLNLLAALSKLRTLRSKEVEKLGGYCSKQLTETFEKVMERFQNLWEKQLEVYKLEEKGLKIMLEENVVPHKKDSKLETLLLQWEKALFGEIRNDEYEKLLTLHENDIQTLVQIRRDWDQFLTSESTPMSSSIPLGWVLPPETEDEQWKAFTKCYKTILP